VTAVNNVTALRTTLPSSSNSVILSGHAIINDGGGGTFVWNPTDSRTDDGGSIIGSATTGRWNRLIDDLVNVKWYGALGDGQRVDDAQITVNTTLLTSTTANFTAADIGTLCSLDVRGQSLGIEHGTITGFISSTQVNVSFTELKGVESAGIFVWGHDDTSNIRSALSAVKAHAYNKKFVPKLYFPPGNYCVSSGFDIDYTYSGISIKGSSFWHLNNTTAKITLMAPADYLIRNTVLGMTWADIWLDGNRLATDVMQFEYFGDTQTFDRCRFSGATTYLHHYGIQTGEKEVDLLTFRDCQLWGDFTDTTYYVNSCIYNENAEAFLINYYDGLIRNGNTLVRFTNQGSCNFRGTQMYDWIQAGILVNSNCASFELADVYNEQDKAYFLKIVPDSATTNFSTLTLRNCYLQTTPIYTCHAMRLEMISTIISASIESDPESALLAKAGGHIDFALQPLILDNCSIVSCVCYRNTRQIGRI